MSDEVDVLLVSPGTTAGWRRADGELARALERLGTRVAVCSSEYRLARHLRRTVLMTDLAEAAAMRRALTMALRRYRPRAIIYSSPQAAMLQPRPRLEGAAVRFDVPAAFNRSGLGSRLLHALERRALRTVRLLLPIGIAPRPDQHVPDVETRTVALPIPIDIAPDARPKDEPIALTYAGNPEKKGLDLAVQAWALTSPTDWRLIVTGIDRDAGRRFLARRGVAEPAGIEWAGVLDPVRYRELLSSARVFLSASRHEDYGLAQLEALGSGALLVTLPSSGAYEALSYARGLGRNLVAEEISPAALARALEAALALGPDERVAYASQARDLVRPHSREELGRRLADEVLPLLLY